MSELGINFIQIIAYIIIFFLLYFFARKFISKILNNLDERKATIEQGIENAESARKLKAEKLAEAENERKEILEKAYSESQEIIDRAKEKESKILAEAAAAKDAFLLHAKKEIDEMKEKSRNEGLAEANEVIALAVKKVFEGLELNEKEQEQIIERSLDNLNRK